MKARTALTAAFYAAILLFLGRFAAGLDWRVLREVRPDPVWLVAALVAGLAHRYLLPYGWLELLGARGGAIADAPRLHHLYARAWLGRYLPGKVGMLAARVLFARELGVGAAAAAHATLVDTALFFLGAATIGFGSLALSGRLFALDARAIALAVLLVTGTLVALAPPVFNRLLRLGARMLGRRAESFELSSAVLARAGLRLVLVLAAGGVSWFCWVRALAPVAASDFAFLWGTLYAPGALAMAALFAPGGVGVRESAQVPLLALSFPPELALVLALGGRVLDVAIDALYFASSALLARHRPTEAAIHSMDGT